MNTPTMTQPQELDLSQLQQVAGGVQSVEAQPQWEVFPFVSVPPSLEWESFPFV
ncbi:hypothetical protein [Ideonella paludis]|uniref:Bacteriocin n=1 Tax=Ideonella paludis TaxID=1233411 RepID=A0ABS5DYM9_9BURK|nr:hypothetical protein [Ideonella paludis]MBQ0936255.1 hypothetical protein [Ideonella paludis]